MIPKENWNNIEPKISQMIASVLELLAASNTHATFFVVGWIAEKNPSLVRQIVEGGHEIASHSYWHKEVFRQKKRKDLFQYSAILVVLEFGRQCSKLPLTEAKCLSRKSLDGILLIYG